MRSLNSFAAAVAAALTVVAIFVGTASATSVVVLYDPMTGNMSLQNTTSGTVGLSAFDIITLGNGTLGPVSGRPGNIGWLSGVAATLPDGTPFVTSNTSAFGYNGIYSQAAASIVGDTMFTLTAFSGTFDPVNPVRGPVGSFYDLGNISVTRIESTQAASQTWLRSVLRTDPDVTPGGVTVTGSFLYNTSPTGGAFTVGQAFSLVPEPGTLALGGVALVLGLTAFRSRARSRPLA